MQMTQIMQQSPLGNLQKARKGFLIKICGMKYRDNITELLALQPDLIGLIFYPKSPRFAEPELEAELLASLPASVQRVGVFVNESVAGILEKVRQYGLTAVQLHGEEPPETCRQLQAEGLTVLKAFSINEDFDFDSLIEYENVCDCFLFDTKGQSYGGNGVTFDWAILDRYRLPVPFLLSGGIGPEHAQAIRQLRHPQLAGIDLNSRFEISPGRKDVGLIGKLLYELEMKSP
jgi:phosphoribosylanthranilate isomerase